MDVIQSSLRLIFTSASPRKITNNSFWEVGISICDELGLKDFDYDIILSIEPIRQNSHHYIRFLSDFLGSPHLVLKKISNYQHILRLKVEYSDDKSSNLASDKSFRFKVVGKATKSISEADSLQGYDQHRSFSIQVLPALSNVIYLSDQVDHVEFYEKTETCRELKFNEQLLKKWSKKGYPCDNNTSNDYNFRDSDAIIAVECPSEFGFFAVLWDAAFCLAAYLTSHHEYDLSDKSLIELGAGTGLLGVLCYKYLGAKPVVVTDIPPITSLIHRNLLENNLSDIDSITVSDYEWGGELSHRSHLCQAEDRLKQTFDFIIGSDVVFDPAYWKSLWQSFQMLSNSNTVVILSFRLRNIQELDFFKCSEARDWNVYEKRVAQDYYNVTQGTKAGELKIFALTKISKYDA
mmetsp:Transcript_28741/g.29074  ORF Transcript_28741/g.29074 Transcript_28741/m.29074 type:complete len:406 (+) Transcript_28741:91-1308(+)